MSTLTSRSCRLRLVRRTESSRPDLWTGERSGPEAPTRSTYGQIHRPPEHTMPTMRAVQVARAGGPLEVVERPIPDPAPGTLRIKVHACGICHSDALVKEGHWPGITFPRVPG